MSMASSCRPDPRDRPTANGPRRRPAQPDGHFLCRENRARLDVVYIGALTHGVVRRAREKKSADSVSAGRRAARPESRSAKAFRHGTRSHTGPSARSKMRLSSPMPGSGTFPKPMTQPEFDLPRALTLIQTGDQEVIAALVERYYPRVQRMVHRQLDTDFRRKHRWILGAFSTGDITHEVFLQVLKGLRDVRCRDEAAFVSFLSTLTFRSASRFRSLFIPINANGLSFSLFTSDRSCGYIARQGGHQSPQKSRTTTLPL